MYSLMSQGLFIDLSLLGILYSQGCMFPFSQVGYSAVTSLTEEGHEGGRGGEGNIHDLSMLPTGGILCSH